MNTPGGMHYKHGFLHRSEKLCLATAKQSKYTVPDRTACITRGSNLVAVDAPEVCWWQEGRTQLQGFIEHYFACRLFCQLCTGQTFWTFAYPLPLKGWSSY